MNKKFLITAVMGLMFFSILSIQPKQATAQQVPTFDLANWVENSLLVKKELIFDKVATELAQVIISNLTNSVVTWINSGFQGNPAFISDPEGFFTDVGDQIAGNFIAGTELGFICEPFSLDIRTALAINYSTTFSQRNFCRLSDVVSNTENFAKFTSGDFSQGGWDSWFEITQNLSNNPMGAQFVAQNELAIRTARGQRLRLMEANWGGGFLSYRDCLAEDRNGNCTKYGPIKTPGSVIEGQLAETLGSDIRKLELADEINEVVGALIGQLVKTVFTQGLSSFGPSGNNYNIYRNTDPTTPIPLTVSCSPNILQIVAGGSVTWTAYVYGGPAGTPSYSWSGESGLFGTNSSSVNVIYTDLGTKTATVRVTKGGQNLVQPCSSTVEVVPIP